jgi:tetratricopeptide (TPR) repeat protein
MYSMPEKIVAESTSDVPLFDEQTLYVDRFIGRDIQLEEIQDAIENTTNNHVFMFLGEGGVGKTAFLRHIAKRYSNNDSIIVVSIDYSQARFQSLSALADSFISLFRQRQIISSKTHDVFRQMQQKTQQAFQEGASDETLQKMMNDSYGYLISKVNLALKTRRLVILSDSVEKAGDVSMGMRINRLAFTFENTVIVVAGRPEKIVLDRFKEEYSEIFTSPKWILHPIHYIDAFDLAEASEYFKRELGVVLDPNLVEKIVILTTGLPILLAITSEWLKHNIALPLAVKRGIDELKALPLSELRALQMDYEYELVGQVRANSDPISSALRVLSFLDRRYDRDILSLALGLNEGEVDSIEPELRRMSFVRSFLDTSSGLLHEEAMRLINAYAWEPRDPGKEERHALARKIIKDYYRPRINELRQKLTVSQVELQEVNLLELQNRQELHGLEMECLDYCYRISWDEGRRFVTELIRDGVSFARQEGIAQELFNRVDKNEAEIAISRINVARGQYSNAMEVLEAACRRSDASIDYQITLLRELSEVPVKPEEQEAYLEEAFEKAKDTNNQLEQARIFNEKGLVYRRQGLWEKAEHNYLKTLEFLQEINDPVQRANTLNNLAYVKLLQGKFEEAESLADIALLQRQALGNQLGVAFSYLTKGGIAETRGDLAQEEFAFNTSARIFEQLGREQNHAQVLVRLSRLCRKKKNYDEAEVLLQAGLRQPAEVRVRAERELGAILRSKALEAITQEERQKLLTQALEAFKKARQTSHIKRDFHEESRVLYDLVFVSFLLNQTVDEYFASSLQDLLNDHEYPVIHAQLEEVYADAQYNRGEVLEAFTSYVRVLQIYSMFHPNKYRAAWRRFRRRLFDQTPEIQRQLFNHLIVLASTLSDHHMLHTAIDGLVNAVALSNGYDKH